MSQSGVNYFVQKYASFDYASDWKIWFDFKTIRKHNITVPRPQIALDDYIVDNRSGADQLYHGVIKPSLYDYVPYVYDDYMFVKSLGNQASFYITPSTGIWSDDFSLIFLNKKTSLGEGLLFNCLETGLLNGENVYKGYRVGYTYSNKPFFEYYTDKGLECLVADFNLPDTHSLNFVKSHDSLSIGYYDILTHANNTQSFNINSNYLLEPTGRYNVGHQRSAIPKEYFYSTPSDLNGYYIDEFLYFSRAIYSQDIEMINSGFVADYVAPVTGSGIIYSTGITGYSTGLVPIMTGITGYGIVGTGLVTNEFGVEYTGYISGPLYANLSGSGVVSLTGEIRTPDYFLGQGSIVVNSGYLREFYTSGVSYMRNVDKEDLLEYVLETGEVGNIAANHIAPYDITKNKHRFFDNNPVRFTSINGQLTYSGSLFNSGTIYAPINYLENDFQVTGNYINTLGHFDKSDTVYTFNCPSTVNYLNKYFSTTGYIEISGVLSSNSMIFFNGQKLNSSQYISSGTSLIFDSGLYDGTEGELSVIEVSGAKSFVSGSYQANCGRNNPNYSLVFMNGQQLIDGIDYNMVSPKSLLSSTGVFKESVSTIYNDGLNNFWKG